MNAAQWSQLEQAAREASKRAYCPYSRFRVGCAVLTGDGAIASGCNVENASYGLTSCAERNAIFRAIGDGATSIVALVVYTPTPAPVTPCGACRQKLREFAADDVPVIVADLSTVRARFTLGELLPASFGPAHLGITDRRP